MHKVTLLFFCACLSISKKKEKEEKRATQSHKRRKRSYAKYFPFLLFVKCIATFVYDTLSKRTFSSIKSSSVYPHFFSVSFCLKCDKHNYANFGMYFSGNYYNLVVERRMGKRKTLTFLLFLDFVNFVGFFFSSPKV